MIQEPTEKKRGFVMRSRNTIFCVLIACAFTAVPALAASQRQGWAVVGVGQYSCGTFVMETREQTPSKRMLWGGQKYFSQAGAYAQWLTGFVSGVNAAAPAGKRQVTVDLDGIYLWVENYCKKHPDKMLMYAAGAFVVHFRASRSSSAHH